MLFFYVFPKLTLNQLQWCLCNHKCQINLIAFWPNMSIFKIALKLIETLQLIMSLPYQFQYALCFCISFLVFGNMIQISQIFVYIFKFCGTHAIYKSWLNTFICLFHVNAANISESQLTAQFQFPFQCTDIPKDIFTLHQNKLIWHFGIRSACFLIRPSVHLMRYNTNHFRLFFSIFTHVFLTFFLGDKFKDDVNLRNFNFFSKKL